MNFYKKIIRSQETRLRILEIMSFLPDTWKVKLQYRIKTGRRLNLEKPERYTEKIQWYKLYYRTALETICADKYAVRGYVESRGLGFLLNDLYAVYDRAEDIDFDSLPAEYVMKANNSSGRNCFVSDNASADHEELRRLASVWTVHRARSISGERCYENIPPKIIFEKLLPRDGNNDLPDYKFFCFDGEPYCLYTMIGYADDHSKGKLGFYDMEFKRLPCRRMDFEPITEELEKPANFEKMAEYARILSAGFPHVRVDFYNISGKIVFGELTFHNASGYTLFDPDEFDYVLGEKFRLPEAPVIEEANGK